MTDELLEQKIAHQTSESRILETLNRQMSQNIEKLLEQKKYQKEKNQKLQAHIDELMQVIERTEKEITKTRRNSTISDIKIEPKIYLKGMFEEFIEEQNALKILIEGQVYYYPLSSYQCRHLPISGARVLVFRSEDGGSLVYGFHVAKLIDTCNRRKGIIKFASEIQNYLKVHIEDYGYINFYPSADLWGTFGYKIGDSVILNEIFIDGKIYFYITEKNETNFDRNEVLKIIMKEEES